MYPISIIVASDRFKPSPARNPMEYPNIAPTAVIRAILPILNLMAYEAPFLQLRPSLIVYPRRLGPHRNVHTAAPLTIPMMKAKAIREIKAPVNSLISITFFIRMWQRTYTFYY